MRIDVITLFPGMFGGPLSGGILQRASSVTPSLRSEAMEDMQDGDKPIHIFLHDLREYGAGNYRQVDDAPYGGGAGMVMRCDVVSDAIETVCENSPRTTPHRIFLSPRGERLTQTRVEELAEKDSLLLLCGRYEGIDQRIIDGGWIDEEISIGDYVLTGGELPAMVLIDAVARLLPGVVSKRESTESESFSAAFGRKREYPHYTRPEEFRSLKVPEVLLSGDHAEIEKWRREHLC